MCSARGLMAPESRVDASPASSGMISIIFSVSVLFKIINFIQNDQHDNQCCSCGPSCWSISHASCSHGRCSCRPGYSPQVTFLIMITIINASHVPSSQIFHQFLSQFQLPEYQVAQYNNLHEMSQYSALSPPRLSACLARATNASLQSPHGRGIQVHRYYPGEDDEDGDDNEDTTTGKASLSSMWSPLASYLILRRQDNELLDVCDDQHRLYLHRLCRGLHLHPLVHLYPHPNLCHCHQYYHRHIHFAKGTR